MVPKTVAPNSVNRWNIKWNQGLGPCVPRSTAPSLVWPSCSDQWNDIIRIIHQQMYIYICIYTHSVIKYNPELFHYDIE